MREFVDIVAAEDKSIGFDFQYYYFIYLLLGLDEHEEIGYEVKDDIHIERKNGNQILLQLKHSVQRNADGSIKNLTERDLDLWKTISNWIHIIEGISVDKNQFEYINKTNFLIVSNKSFNEKNNFIIMSRKLKDKTIDIIEFRKYLEELYTKTKLNKEDTKGIKVYIENLLKKDNQWIILFIQQLEFELEQTQIIQMIKNKLKKIIYDDSRIDDVFDALYSNIKMNIFFNVIDRKKIIITFEEFRDKYKNCMGKGIKWKLPVKKYENNYEQDHFLPEENICIKQIEDIDNLDLYEKIDILNKKLHLEKNILDWEQKGHLTPIEIDEFHSDAISKWQNTFKKSHRTSHKLEYTTIPRDEITEIIVKNSLDCLDEILGKDLFIEGQSLGTDLSNGEFYYLSNIPKIGWLINWRGKYKTNEK